MKVIFLDFDGVLTSEDSLSKGLPIDPNAVELLNQLLEKSGANIVVSSSWRLSNSVPMLSIILKEAGLKFSERVIGTTQSIPARIRGDEIKLWLRQVPVDGFVILDDTDDMGNLFPHLVLVYHREGLQKKDIDKALEILERACREVK